MPARNSSMELSSPDPESTGVSTRRKSGRVSQKPKLLSPSSATGNKRKRGHGDTDVEMDDTGDEDEEESSEESEDEPDAEELKERRQKARQAKKVAPKKPASKPAAKKAKQTNGDTVSLAIRPAKSKAPRKKPQHQTADAEAVGGLYGEFRMRSRTQQTTNHSPHS